MRTESRTRIGTYKYKITVGTSYDDGGVQSLKPVTLNVKVVDKRPTIKLKTSTFKFNKKYPYSESVNSVITAYGNIQKGSEINLDVSGASYEFVGKEADKAKADTVSSAIEIKAYKDTEKKKITLNFKLKQVDVSSFSYTYKVSGIKLNNVEIQPFKITLKSHFNEPAVTVKAAGSLNPVDKSSKITYKMSIKHLINPDILSVNVVYYDTTVRDYRISPDFKAIQDYEHDKPYETIVTAKQILQANKTYDVYLAYSFVNVNRTVYTKIKITPKQKLPKLRTNKSKVE